MWIKDSEWWKRCKNCVGGYEIRWYKRCKRREDFRGN
jgi:hypothetical protein